jgi:tetratricopeptide (TPR) repeat protein
MTKSRHTAAMASILVVASFLPSVAWGQTTIDELQEQLSALEADVASETEDIAAVWRGLGDAYYQIGAYEDAIPYYQNALAYCEADPATYAQDIAKISHRLGFAYEQTGSALLEHSSVFSFLPESNMETDNQQNVANTLLSACGAVQTPLQMSYRLIPQPLPKSTDGHTQHYAQQVWSLVFTKLGLYEDRVFGS